METIYDVDYFINKFQSIPEELWLVRKFSDGDKGCVNNHCLRNGDDEFHALSKIFNSNANLFNTTDNYGLSKCDFVIQQCVNNGDDSNYQQPTAKQRILAALHDIKKLQQPEKSETIVIEKIKYVSVPESIKINLQPTN